MTSATDMDILDIYHEMLATKSFKIVREKYCARTIYLLFTRDTHQNDYRGIIARSIDHILSQSPLDENSIQQMQLVIEDIFAEIQAIEADLDLNAQHYSENKKFLQPSVQLNLSCVHIKELMEKRGLLDIFTKNEMAIHKQKKKPDSFISDTTLALMYEIFNNQKK